MNPKTWKTVIDNGIELMNKTNKKNTKYWKSKRMIRSIEMNREKNYVMNTIDSKLLPHHMVQCSERNNNEKKKLEPHALLFIAYVVLLLNIFFFYFTVV